MGTRPLDERGYRVMQLYKQLHEDGNDAPLRDLLADLMHYADTYAFDFDHELDAARSFYADEIEAALIVENEVST